MEIVLQSNNKVLSLDITFHHCSLLRIWKEWRSSYLNGTAWMEWTNQQFSRVKSYFGFETDSEVSQQTPPVESMLIDNDEGFFGV